MCFKYYGQAPQYPEVQSGSSLWKAISRTDRIDSDCLHSQNSRDLIFIFISFSIMVTLGCIVTSPIFAPFSTCMTGYLIVCTAHRAAATLGQREAHISRDVKMKSIRCRVCMSKGNHEEKEKMPKGKQAVAEFISIKVYLNFTKLWQSITKV